MVQENILLVLSLLFAVVMLIMLSEKLKISYPIFLVIAGLMIGFIPAIPVITLNPDVVFLVFLPPLLYAAAWNTSWKDFWKFRRPIGLLSFGLVIFTSTAIAFISNAIIPDFPLAFGFLLGGIISPPDAVAATSVLQGLKVPKRAVSILEGESLVNDASSLIVFRFALAAVITGQFSFWKAGTEFFMVVVMGILIGVAIAWIVSFVHRYLPTTGSIDTIITFICPYIMYILAEHFHYSGVLAVVSGGLFLSYRSHELFTYNSRMQVYASWQTIIFLLNGIVFILIGLQLPQILAGLGQYSVLSAISYSLIISMLIIVIRIVWVYPAAYIPRMLSRKIRVTEPRPNAASVFLIGWSGMRGVVSLAAALAIPLTLPGGEVFPNRNLLLFITFIVILVTLVLQGLSLPWIIKKLGLEDPGENKEEQELSIKILFAEATLDHMKTNYAEEINTIEAYSRLKERYERMAEISARKLQKDNKENTTTAFLPRYRQMLLEVVTVKRKELQKLHRDNTYSDEIIRNKEHELDLEEARLTEQ